MNTKLSLPALSTCVSHGYSSSSSGSRGCLAFTILSVHSLHRKPASSDPHQTSCEEVEPWKTSPERGRPGGLVPPPPLPPTPPPPPRGEGGGGGVDSGGRRASKKKKIKDRHEYITIYI